MQHFLHYFSLFVFTKKDTNNSLNNNYKGRIKLDTNMNI